MNKKVWLHLNKLSTNLNIFHFDFRQQDQNTKTLLQLSEAGTDPLTGVNDKLTVTTSPPA